MDPDAALQRVRDARLEVAGRLSDPSGTIPEFLDAARELVDAVEALDEWLLAGGFLPAAWSPGAVP